MSTASPLPLPAAHALRKLGRELALARRKRAISTADMASRLLVSRDTLWRLERGDATVAVGTLATALFVLQLHDRLANLAAPACIPLVGVQPSHLSMRPHGWRARIPCRSIQRRCRCARAGTTRRPFSG